MDAGARSSQSKPDQSTTAPVVGLLAACAQPDATWSWNDGVMDSFSKTPCCIDGAEVRNGSSEAFKPALTVFILDGAGCTASEVH